MIPVFKSKLFSKLVPLIRFNKKTDFKVLNNKNCYNEIGTRKIPVYRNTAYNGSSLTCYFMIE